MKKSINEIFDEITPQELDGLSAELNAPKLSDDALSSIKSKVYAKTNLEKPKKNAKKLCLRVGIIAACIVLIVGIASVAIIMQNDEPKIEPAPPDEPFSPIIDSSVDSAVLSAEDIASVFNDGVDSNGTNQYEKIYAPNQNYLNLIPIPDAEYLPIYSAKKVNASKSDLQKFINKYLDSATKLFGINSKKYEIKKDERWNGDVYYEAEISGDKKGLRFVALDNSIYFTNYTLGDKRLKINGNMISVLESDTDEQIKEKLSNTITYLCKLFGKDYSDVKINRVYSNKQLRMITVYIYSAENTIFPSNFLASPMTSEYITLELYTDGGEDTLYHWDGSQSEAFLTNIELYETVESQNEYYQVNQKAKMLTLEQAEDYLKKGYVFGGHTCPLCMAEQSEVDFSDYTYLTVKYVSNVEGKLFIPFYAFYKYLGKNEYGMDTYARTYVAAIEVSGYEEYFESQKENHITDYNVVIE